MDNAQTVREVHELLKRQQDRQVRAPLAAARAAPRSRAAPHAVRCAQRGVTREHEAILEGVYEARARHFRAYRASFAALTRISRSCHASWSAGRSRTPSCAWPRSLTWTCWP
jgi:hypothetical protein